MHIDMKRLFFMAVLLSIVTPFMAQESMRNKVLLETDSGRIVIALYDNTPLHRDNFLKNVREGIYDGVLFHRVIRDFMIQTGDTASRNAKPREMLGDSPESVKIPAEILYPQLIHKRGAVAAAREGDDTNPERFSSSFQFYICWGRRLTDYQLDNIQERVSKATKGTVNFSPEVREVYKTQGGIPHLDGQYTVFGEVLEGLDVVDKIQNAAKDSNDRPLLDVRIIKATLIE